MSEILGFYADLLPYELSVITLAKEGSLLTTDAFAEMLALH